MLPFTKKSILNEYCRGWSIPDTANKHRQLYYSSVSSLTILLHFQILLIETFGNSKLFLIQEFDTLVSILLIYRYWQKSYNEAHWSLIIISAILTYLYRLILIAVLITQKFYNDMFYSNNYVAFLGGITCEELNCIEVEFLETLNWECTLEESDYYRYSDTLNGIF